MVKHGVSAEEKCEWHLCYNTPQAPHPAPLVSSALLDYDIRSLELPNGAGDQD